MPVSNLTPTMKPSSTTGSVSAMTSTKSATVNPSSIVQSIDRSQRQAVEVARLNVRYHRHGARDACHGEDDAHRQLERLIIDAWYALGDILQRPDIDRIEEHRDDKCRINRLRVARDASQRTNRHGQHIAEKARASGANSRCGGRGHYGLAQFCISFGSISVRRSFSLSAHR